MFRGVGVDLHINSRTDRREERNCLNKLLTVNCLNEISRKSKKLEVTLQKLYSKYIIHYLRLYKLSELGEYMCKGGLIMQPQQP